MDLQKASEVDNREGVDPLQHLVGIDYFDRHLILTVCYLIVMSVSCLIGIVGNIMVIGGVCVYRKLRTKPNIFIVNLAVADFSVGAVVQGFSIIGLVEGYGFFQDKPILCDAIATICLVSCSCSMWNIAAIAFNRYICLCHNHLYAKIYTWKQSIMIAIILWVICFILEIPNYFNWGGHIFDAKTMACSYDRTAHYTYTLFFVLVAIAPPLILVCFCYLRIFLYVRASKKALQDITSKDDKNKAKSSDTGWDSKELKLAKTLFIVFITFLVFWAPYAVVVLIDFNDDWPKVVYVIVIQLAHTNSSANSIIYAATNKDFREGYRRFICCWSCRTQRSKQKPKFDAARYLAAHHFFNTKNMKETSYTSEETNDTGASEETKSARITSKKIKTPNEASTMNNNHTNKERIMSNGFHKEHKEPNKGDDVTQKETKLVANETSERDIETENETQQNGRVHTEIENTVNDTKDEHTNGKICNVTNTDIATDVKIYTVSEDFNKI